MPKKIVFMGTPMFAVPILKSLYQNGYPISDVYTQPPQKSQRGQRINKSPIQGIAETLNLENNLNAQDISEQLSSLAAENILDNIDNILDDKAKFIEQNHAQATYAPKIQKLEGKINWDENALNIIGKINGLYPVPGAFFIFKGERYKILKADIGNGIGSPGEVVSDYLEVACGNRQSIKIKEIQRQGKKPQNIGEFMLGSQIKKGSLI